MISKSWSTAALCLVVLLQDGCSFTVSSTNNQLVKKMSTELHANASPNTENLKDESMSRRNVLKNSIFTPIAMTSLSSLLMENANAAVLQSGPCASGQGDACEDLAEGNEFIRSLQKKSSENRARNEQEALFAYNMKNYPDFFASLNPPKYLVMKSDGSFDVFTDEELNKLKQAGKIQVVMPKAKGGKVTDVTQKPYMLLKE